MTRVVRPDAMRPRTQRQMTRVALAEQVGVSLQTVEELERGAPVPSEAAAAICRNLDLPEPALESSLVIQLALLVRQRCSPARGNRPLLVIHGEEDSLIDLTEARQAFAASAAAEKKLCLIADHGHNDLAYSPLYWESIGAFVHRLSPA